MREPTLWIFHILAGIIILIFLGIHMGIMHLDTILTSLGVGYKNPLSWSSVLIRNKALFFTITYILLLGAALYHGFYGLRNILFELSLGKSAQKAVNWMLFFVGLFLFIYGGYAAIAAYVI